MEYLFIGIAMFFNIVVLKIKFDMDAYASFTLDIIVFFLLSYLLGKSLGGMIIATISSALFSIFLLVSPVKFKG